MRLSSLPRVSTSCLVNRPVLNPFAGELHTYFKLRAYCAISRLDRLSSPVHRRQVLTLHSPLTTTSLSLLPSWLTFSTMWAKADFELPGEKWWSTDTVAVVTGGELAVLIAWSSSSVRCVQTITTLRS